MNDQDLFGDCVFSHRPETDRSTTSEPERENPSDSHKENPLLAQSNPNGPLVSPNHSINYILNEPSLDDSPTNSRSLVLQPQQPDNGDREGPAFPLEGTRSKNCLSSTDLIQFCLSPRRKDYASDPLSDDIGLTSPRGLKRARDDEKPADLNGSERGAGNGSVISKSSKGAVHHGPSGHSTAPGKEPDKPGSSSITEYKKRTRNRNCQTYEIYLSPVSPNFIPSQHPNSSVEVWKIFNLLYSAVGESEPEGKVCGIGVIVVREAKFMYKVIEIQNPVCCEYCSKLFRNETLLNVHIKKAHAKLNGVQASGQILCPECGEVFKNPANLRRHTTLVHSGEQVFRCVECGARFGSRHPFVAHMRDHHKVLPKSRRRNLGTATALTKDTEIEEETLRAWKCSTCAVLTSNKGNMVRHVDLAHLKLRRFSCNQCNLMFGTEHNLHCHRISAHAGASSSGN